MLRLILPKDKGREELAPSNGLLCVSWEKIESIAFLFHLYQHESASLNYTRSQWL